MVLLKDKAGMANSIIDQTQQKAAKLAGTMFLILIILYFLGQIITSYISSATAKRFTELTIDVLYLACTLILIISLYQVLKPVNKKLAQAALFWRLAEAFIILIMMIFSLEGNSQIIGFNISSILFSIGSLIFFYLFLKSKYIPATISVFGIFASVMVTIVGFGILIFPNHSGIIQLGWIPMLIAEIILAYWLLVKGLKPLLQTNEI